jgi:hypothetical protein
VTDRLRPRIEEFKTKLDRLPSPTEPPQPTLEIIGRNHKERDWQRLFVHFLSGDESHGLEYELLRHVLTALSERPGFDFSFSHFDLNNVQIETEVDTSNGGRVDIVSWVPEAWFICWELKVHSSESGTQTGHYVEADSFESIELDKSDPGVVENYIYLSPDEEPAAEASEFHPVSWEWVASELQTFLEDSHGQYPARTTAQVEDFIGTIRSELKMTEYEENEQEKAELYLTTTRRFLRCNGRSRTVGKPSETIGEGVLLMSLKTEESERPKISAMITPESRLTPCRENRNSGNSSKVAVGQASINRVGEETLRIRREF